MMMLIVVVLIVLVGVFLAVGIWISGGFFARYLADRGIIWVRVPEMHAVVITRDRNLFKVVIASSDEGKNQHLRQELRQLLTDGKVEIVPSGKLIFMGGFPWDGYQLYGWYELSRDDDNPEIDPIFALNLAERTWDYTAQSDDRSQKAFIEEWGVDTSDPIQVTPKIVILAEVVNPQKTLFGVRYFQEAIQKRVLTAWKRSVQSLRYFTYDDDTAEGVDSNLQTQAQINMNKIMGFSDNGVCGTFVVPDNLNDLDRSRVVHEILLDYGVWIKQVLIRDIDPTDPNIRQNLEARLQATTEAAANRARAEGDRDATMLRADGEAGKIRKEGQATAEVAKALLEQKALGLAKMIDASGMEKAEAAQLIIRTEAFQKAMELVGGVTMVGDPTQLVMKALAGFGQVQ